eukprot:CAMPEP_0115211834 /NCGR_PEP_ID=MMETSP0270-20121206/22967_1 /TAXON_ID=71861 /ORGANISM="Scrippsiella trochoidea, Strain CCMP3099" /LENGTH=471 /DNA_ID=CAMNT_0002625533 /DNA_START=128 /DNA_END=1541 /DNA_ORIENTATION=+
MTRGETALLPGGRSRHNGLWGEIHDDGKATVSILVVLLGIIEVHLRAAGELEDRPRAPPTAHLRATHVLESWEAWYDCHPQRGDVVGQLLVKQDLHLPAALGFTKAAVPATPARLDSYELQAELKVCPPSVVSIHGESFSFVEEPRRRRCFVRNSHRSLRPAGPSGTQSALSSPGKFCGGCRSLSTVTAHGSVGANELPTCGCTTNLAAGGAMATGAAASLADELLGSTEDKVALELGNEAESPWSCGCTPCTAAACCSAAGSDAAATADELPRSVMELTNIAKSSSESSSHISAQRFLGPARRPHPSIATDASSSTDAAWCMAAPSEPALVGAARRSRLAGVVSANAHSGAATSIRGGVSPVAVEAQVARVELALLGAAVGQVELALHEGVCLMSLAMMSDADPPVHVMDEHLEVPSAPMLRAEFRALAFSCHGALGLVPQLAFERGTAYIEASYNPWGMLHKKRGTRTA